MGAKKFEKLLYSFLDQGCYRKWVADSQIRNTGPFIGGASFGTHNAVKVFYSPEVWDWLKYKNREGEIPDGAMIVKEMFPSPAREGSKLNASAAVAPGRTLMTCGCMTSRTLGETSATNRGGGTPNVFSTKSIRSFVSPHRAAIASGVPVRLLNSAIGYADCDDQ